MSTTAIKTSKTTIATHYNNFSQQIFVINSLCELFSYEKSGVFFHIVDFLNKNSNFDNREFLGYFDNKEMQEVFHKIINTLDDSSYKYSDDDLKEAFAPRQIDTDDVGIPIYTKDSYTSLCFEIFSNARIRREYPKLLYLFESVMRKSEFWDALCNRIQVHIIMEFAENLKEYAEI